MALNGRLTVGKDMYGNSYAGRSGDISRVNGLVSYDRDCGSVVHFVIRIRRRIHCVGVQTRCL